MVFFSTFHLLHPPPPPPQSDLESYTYALIIYVGMYKVLVEGYGQAGH